MLIGYIPEICLGKTNDRDCLGARIKAVSDLRVIEIRTGEKLEEKEIERVEWKW